MILDGGPCEVVVESTIIDLSGDQPVIRRPGMISATEIAAVMDMPFIVGKSTESQRTPGMHHLHYAPQTMTELVKTNDMLTLLQNIKTRPIAVLLHSQWGLPLISGVQTIHMPAEAINYAHDLYDTLRTVDNQHYQKILIEAVPEDVEWEAIRDRLFKATGSKGLIT